MAKSLCLLHANCQGDALKILLEASPLFNRHFYIRRGINYDKSALPQDVLDNTALFIYQYLSPAWGDFSTDALLKRLPQGASSICIPNFFFKGYWPFWTNATQEIEFADSFMEKLLQRNLSFEAALRLYLKCDRALAGDVEETASQSIAKEREREAHTPIKYTHILEEHWRQKQLFLTINHPGVELLAYMANGVLQMLGFPRLTEKQIASFINPHGDFWLPIHPVVGSRLKLPFAGVERKYACFGASLTHAQYMSCYLACRKYKIANFTGVLRDLDRSPQFAAP